MTAASIFYPILTIVLLYILFKNIKKSISYKKENMQVLLLLNEDDRRFRLMSRLLMAVMRVYKNRRLYLKGRNR
jgi:hypothetical protein